MPWRRRRQEPTQGAWGQHWRDCAWIRILSEDVGPLHFMKSPSSLGGEISGRALAVGEDREALTIFVMPWARRLREASAAERAPVPAEPWRRRDPGHPRLPLRRTKNVH